jgi:hypothetical protein
MAFHIMKNDVAEIADYVRFFLFDRSFHLDVFDNVGLPLSKLAVVFCIGSGCTFVLVGYRAMTIQAHSKVMFLISVGSVGFTKDNVTAGDVIEVIGTVLFVQVFDQFVRFCDVQVLQLCLQMPGVVVLTDSLFSTEGAITECVVRFLSDRLELGGSGHLDTYTVAADFKS